MLGFITTARALFARLAATPTRIKRKSKGKAKGRGAIGIHALNHRAELKRAAKKQAQLEHLRYGKRKKAEPIIRPRDPRGPEPGP